jgi:hypothetical protein
MLTITPKEEPPYPGAPVLLTAFERGGEHGDVRVQDYGSQAGTRYHVCCFIPGVVHDLPGDTPKVAPEIDSWAAGPEMAETIFFRYCDQVRAAGWTEVA